MSGGCGDFAEEVVRRAQAGDTDALDVLERHGTWAQRRRAGLGGSDVAAALGLSPHRRPIAVWQDKVGLARHWEGNERTRWGQILEPCIADEYQRRRGGAAACHLEGPFRPERHPDRWWHVFTLDRLVLNAAPPAESAPPALRVPPRELVCRVLEIKSHGFARRGEYGDEGTNVVPEPILCQVAWYVAGVECDGGADVAALFDTHEYREFHLERDRELEAYLLEEVERWWRAYVIPRVEPPPDGSEAFSRYLRERFAATTGRLLDPTDADRVALARLRALEAVRRRLGPALKLAQQDVELRIGDADGYELGVRQRLTYRLEKQRVNHAAVAAEMARQLGLTAEALEQVQRRHLYSPRRVLRLPRAWSHDGADLERVASMLEGAGGAHDDVLDEESDA